MSHGGGTDETVEINLIPMIDIVIQLITFFLMLTNFDKSNTDERVRLPLADLPAPTESNSEEVLVLNIDDTGRVQLLGDRYDVDSLAFQQQIAREAQAAMQNMMRYGTKIEMVGSRPKLWTTVIIRADKDVDYGKILSVMNTCRAMGFDKYSLRAASREVM